MDFKQYPSYKDSGVEWLGKVPEHWMLGRLKNLVQIKNGSDYKNIEVEKSDDAYPVYGSGGIFTYASNFMYDKESILLGRKGTINKPLYVTEPFWAVDTMFYSIIKHNVVGKFIYYQALSFPFEKYSSNTALPSMTQTDLLNLAVTIPSVEEQTKIVSFLDSETSRIDNLIAKQEKLIEKLEEYRKSVISHAVTKGLDPNAKIKDSGVEWLGEVPEHWVILKLKQITKLESGNSLALEDIQSFGNYPVYGGNNIRGYTHDYNLDGNYILIGRQGSLCGNINYGFGKFWATEHAVVVYPKKQVNHLYLGELLRTMNLNQYSLASAQAGLSVERISNIYSIYPPIEEQNAIGELIKAKTSYIDSLITKQKELIAKLKNYRTSIISHAVTGKIDVRDLVA